MSSTPPSLLLQLDTDPQPSVFDAVVAIDAGVDQLLRHGGIRPETVRDLVHGALFTRGPADLHRSAIFIGGSDVSRGEAVLAEVQKTFFGPFRVSVLLDAKGANTTAAAAVLAATEGAGGSLVGQTVAVLAATGPVGQRVARLLARLGARVALGARQIDQPETTAAHLRSVTSGDLTPFTLDTPDSLAAGLQGASVVISTGPVGVRLLPESILRGLEGLAAVIDLNAVPPLGVEGIEAADRGTKRDGLRAWGALGVGGTKMKIHKKAVQELFTTNTRILDAEEILDLARSLN